MYPISSVKVNVSRLWECDLKLFRRGFPLAVWDAPSAYFGQIKRLSEDFIYSRIKDWRLNRRSAQSLLPAVRAVDGGATQAVVAPFEENFRTAGVLVPANADVPRILVVPCGRFGRKSR